MIKFPSYSNENDYSNMKFLSEAIGSLFNLVEFNAKINNKM